jgi:ribosome biogenesis GTPase
LEADLLQSGTEPTLGTVVRAYGGFYFVRLDANAEVVNCRSRGKVRQSARESQRALLVGDRVRLSLAGGEPVVEATLPRTSELIRPPIANVDLVLVVIAAANPAPNLLFADRLLVSVERAALEALVIVNKVDLVTTDAAEDLAGYFQRAGYSTFRTSAKGLPGVDEVRLALKGRTATVAGASGVGKSTLINALLPGSSRETGELSDKLSRGRHTTRHSELWPLPGGGYLADTPGFTALELEVLEPRQLAEFFPEMANLHGDCRFVGCLHEKEPDCAIKTAVASGEISEGRYAHYLVMLAEAKSRPTWMR